MSKPPLISVVIPCYNAASTVNRCIDSAMRQTVTDGIEIIAIDDCSTDGTLGILSDLTKAHSEIHVIEHKRNSGVSTSRNDGIEA
ncbi:MAG: glycosyltransferase, partial [Victivallales bacterium]|nr:glycosyltransferase [Victivallales bacterium]